MHRAGPRPTPADGVRGDPANSPPPPPCRSHHQALSRKQAVFCLTPTAGSPPRGQVPGLSGAGARSRAGSFHHYTMKLPGASWIRTRAQTELDLRRCFNGHGAIKEEAVLPGQFWCRLELPDTVGFIKLGMSCAPTPCHSTGLWKPHLDWWSHQPATHQATARASLVSSSSIIWFLSKR